MPTETAPSARRIPFRPEFETLIRQGIKTATTRSKPYGYLGDVLEAFPGTKIMLTSVRRVKLYHVAANYHRQEGFERPEGFIAVWREIHPTRGFRPDDDVWLHEFKVVE